MRLKSVIALFWITFTACAQQQMWTRFNTNLDGTPINGSVLTNVTAANVTNVTGILDLTNTALWTPTNYASVLFYQYFSGLGTVFTNTSGSYVLVKSGTVYASSGISSPSASITNATFNNAIINGVAQSGNAFQSFSGSTNSWQDSLGVISGPSSHADSNGQTGTNYDAHADSEGICTSIGAHADSESTVDGQNAHGDSFSFAHGQDSHSDSGGVTTKYGLTAHAIVNGIANGTQSFALGYNGVANTNNSGEMTFSSSSGDTNNIPYSLRINTDAGVYIVGSPIYGDGGGLTNLNAGYLTHSVTNLTVYTNLVVTNKDGNATAILDGVVSSYSYTATNAPAGDGYSAVITPYTFTSSYFLVDSNGNMLSQGAVECLGSTPNNYTGSQNNSFSDGSFFNIVTNASNGNSFHDAAYNNVLNSCYDNQFDNFAAQNTLVNNASDTLFSGDANNNDVNHSVGESFMDNAQYNSVTYSYYSHFTGQSQNNIVDHSSQNSFGEGAANNTLSNNVTSCLFRGNANNNTFTNGEVGLLVLGQYFNGGGGTSASMCLLGGDGTQFGPITNLNSIVWGGPIITSDNGGRTTFDGASMTISNASINNVKFYPHNVAGTLTWTTTP